MLAVSLLGLGTSTDAHAFAEFTFDVYNKTGQQITIGEVWYQVKPASVWEKNAATNVTVEDGDSSLEWVCITDGNCYYKNYQFANFWNWGEDETNWKFKYKCSATDDWHWIETGWGTGYYSSTATQRNSHKVYDCDGSSWDDLNFPPEGGLTLAGSYGGLLALAPNSDQLVAGSYDHHADVTSTIRGVFDPDGCVRDGTTVSVLVEETGKYWRVDGENVYADADTNDGDDTQFTIDFLDGTTTYCMTGSVGESFGLKSKSTSKWLRGLSGGLLANGSASGNRYRFDVDGPRAVEATLLGSYSATVGTQAPSQRLTATQSEDTDVSHILRSADDSACIEDGDTVVVQGAESGLYWRLDGADSAIYADTVSADTSDARFTIQFLDVAGSCFSGEIGDRIALRNEGNGMWLRALSGGVFATGSSAGGHYRLDVVGPERVDVNLEGTYGGAIGVGNGTQLFVGGTYDMTHRIRSIDGKECIENGDTVTLQGLDSGLFWRVANDLAYAEALTGDANDARYTIRFMEVEGTCLTGARGEHFGLKNLDNGMWLRALGSGVHATGAYSNPSNRYSLWVMPPQ